MRILQVKTSAGRGGAETLLLHLTGDLIRRGHEVFTVFAEEGWLISAAEAKGYPTAVENIASRALLPGIVHVRKAIADQRSDVVLAHGARVNLPAAIGSALSGIPSVGVEHNVDGWRETSRLLNATDRLAGRLNAKRIAVSGAVEKMLRDLRIVPPEKIELVKNAIDVEGVINHGGDPAERRRGFGFRPEHTVVVTVARLSEQKGHSHLLAAIPSVLASHPKTRFLLCGDGTLRGELERQAAALGITDKIVFAGAIDRIPEVLAACDLFVLPSLWEGLPLALLEAMAAGLPVIATAVSGTPEVVDNGRTGLLVPPANSMALAGAIDRLLGDSEEMGRLARDGKAHILANHSITGLVDRYEEILESCLG